MMRQQHRSSRIVHLSAVALITLGSLGVAGCAAPSHEQLAQKLATELAAAEGGKASSWEEPALLLAKDALDGMCAVDEYWEAISQDLSVAYAWSATCLLYYRSEMSEYQIDTAKSIVAKTAERRSQS